MSEVGVQPFSNNLSPVPLSPSVNYTAFIDFLSNILCNLLDSGEQKTELLKTLQSQACVDCVQKFMTDAQTPVIVAQKYSNKEGDEEGEEDYQYGLTTDVHYSGPKVFSVAFVKRAQVIETDKKFFNQLHIFSLEDSSPYETLHTFISNICAPYFKSYVKEAGIIDKDGDKMAPTLEKKIAEVEMGLLHLQQNIDIPEVNLAINPFVAQVINKCAEENRKPKVDDFLDKLEDSNFLNQLQAGVNRWIREIQKVTKLDRDPSSGTALQEVSFWLNLERALNRIQEKRESLEVTLTLEILKTGKRFHATVSFDSDTGLKQALDQVRNYNIMMKDFPINDLLSATDIDKIRLAIQIIFGSLRKIRNTRYPAARGLRFVEAISRDLTNQMLKILVTRKLMHITFDEFEKTMKECFDVFSVWDEEYDKFQALLRELTKKKRDEHYRMVWRISPMHKTLQSRLDQVRRFRRQHDQLRNVILRVLRPASGDKSASSPREMAFPDVSDANAIDEVNSAYENVKEVDVLDLSKEGADVWEAASRRYDERIDRVENKITAKLRDQLGTAKNANEMFRIFSRFNALFIRPQIRGAISEYQTQLIQRVKADIEALHHKFTAQYAHSSASRLSHSRDIPPVSGSIIWAKQIERQLSTYLRRVEDVIGKGWENHVEGAKLKADGDAFKQKLNTQELFDEWTRKVQQRNLGISGKIFAVEVVKTLKGPVNRLCVNFSPEIITLYKEVRNMRPLNFRVPLVIVNKAHHVNQLYPFAISLDEAVRSYETTITKVSENEKIAMLIASMKKEIQSLILEGIDLTWESYKLETYVYKFAETVYSFQEKVDELLGIEQTVQNELKALEVCPYEHNTFAEILCKIQKCVDNLSLKSYSNVAQWVNYIDKEVEKKLADRLHSSIIAWNRSLMRTLSDHTDAITDDEYPAVDEPRIKDLIHEIRITNQVLCVSPPIEEARHCLLLELFQHESIVLTLQRIHSGRYTLTVEAESEYKKTYKSLLKMLPDSAKILKDTYCTIDKIIEDASKYIKTWLDFQSLWDLQPDLLYERLGKDVSVWMKCVSQIREARKTFDTQESSIKFGPITIDYNKVQSKVNFKYDAWHKDVLAKFGAMLGTEMQDFHRQVAKARSELESHSVDASSTSEAVNVITYVQQLKRQLNQWEKQVNTYAHGQKILERQRYQFPVQWLDVENIKGEWSAFNDILKRKNASIQNQVSLLQKKIQAENEVVETKTQDMLKDWENDKPVLGNIHPTKACRVLNDYDSKLNKMKQERDNILKAKEALEIEDFEKSNTKDRFRVAIEELQDLKEVWDELSNVWKKLDDLRDTPWVSVQPRKLRSSLDEIMSDLKRLPARMRQYAAYQYVKNLIQSYIKVNILIIELKSEAVKERHWRILMKKLGVFWSLGDLTLAQIWDAELLKYEMTVKDIMLVAQGEKALEEFLKQLSETWKTYSLDLINYQNKCRIIRGWDELLDKIKEHINSLGAMKLSPYYKEFAEEALSWEDKLNRLNSLFDTWIDVQRRWVYLDGIFGATADIKILLPVETQKFQSVSSDFLNLMKKVSRSPLVLDVLYIQGIQKTLERLLELLNKIQKALGEYLEKERASFPRFYFVGDEDLLEIIGNAKNIPKLQKHFKKMFAGVHSLILNDDASQVLGISSKEGEEVHFLTPVNIVEHPKINDWLSLIEKEMRITLADRLAECVREITGFKDKEIDPDAYINWIDKYQAQLVVLGAQVAWSESVENALTQQEEASLQIVLNTVTNTLNVLADSVLQPQSPVRRKKLEHLIIEHVHQRDVIRSLIAADVKSPQNFAWLSHMRFYFDPKNPDPLTKLSIKMANADFKYGFEYLGVQEKLVQTPLTDRCYLTMTQALEARLGGSPFGPAGTGKTESVKALGNQLGRFVLVFNCDETFDFQAMGRIFVGLCQVGAWGCFDEFNRLEERMLSAVSQQIQTIQEALREVTEKHGKEKRIELVGKHVSLHPNMAIFITMNPGYAGRSNLPDNLKKLFRSLAMTQPDLVLIAQVMLYSQGFRNAELLAHKVVPFFRLCNEQLSNQSHYDFGLRSLKNVLIMAGNIKRDRMREPSEQSSEDKAEQEILIQSIMQSFSPRLISEDLLLLTSLVNDVFPGSVPTRVDLSTLKNEVIKVCAEWNLEASETNPDMGALWLEKILQLYEITNLNHGLMMVGPSGSGKTMAWRVLLTALNRIEKSDGVAHIIDPKAISKDALYGTLDPNTREWNDGLFTHVLRKIIDNVRGEMSKRQWIIFDGDVDPEWVENLNSVLDDNKLLTLPNGERLPIPPNVRIMFEVQDLKYATLATVSRCGMIWFSAELVSTTMLFSNFLNTIRKTPVDSISISSEASDSSTDPNLTVQRAIADLLEPFFTIDGLVASCLEFAEKEEHIMTFTKNRALSSLFSMLMQSVKQVIQYNTAHPDFPMNASHLENFILRSLAHSILWSFTGDCKLRSKQAIGDFIKKQFAIPIPEEGYLIDFEPNIDGEYTPWSVRVPHIEVETHRVGATDLVVPTIDTVRHESLVYGWLAEHKPLILCGPPGSGKTMTLFSSLRSLPEFEVVGLNFSSATSPELLIKTFDQYCEYRRTPNGTILSPIQLNKWLVIFCDEINLPDEDKYGTQRVISFIRQIVEHGGFYRTSDQTFIKLERIQFVGACNPPTDPGRKPLSPRFLRHVSVLYVDYSGEVSLKQIYGTFNRAMLRIVPYLLKYSDALTNAMVEFFLTTQEHFTVDMQPHYIYSPRELTRWVRGIREAILPVENLTVEGLVRLWAHEAFRLFQDRLVYEEERKWTEEMVYEVASKHFSDADLKVALQQPILYSNWLTKDYLPVDQNELRQYVKARLKVFHEEELDVPLVLFDEVLDHVLRIDRVFRQPQGHLLLIGVSGAGKTTLCRFVAWINGLSVVQIKVHNKYTMANFDDDLRNILRRCGCKGEKIAFLLDEGNLLQASFLERMNTLLANGEVPGLFEGDEYTTLMTQCKEGAQRDGLMLDSQDELYRWFTNEITRNLHVVFTMNPSNEGLKDKASTSPALFNRCVLNWFGDWSDLALYQVATELTTKIDLEWAEYSPPSPFPKAFTDLPEPPSHREAVTDSFVYVHQTLQLARKRIQHGGGNVISITPRNFLDFIEYFVKLYNEKRSEIEEHQLHLRIGLKKISETLGQVEELQESLALKRNELEQKNKAASAKLQEMVMDQQEAEKQKVASEELKIHLAQQTEEIAKKTEEVKKDLERVEPAVLEAKQAVQGIKKQHLIELRSLREPPAPVKLALESICLLLGQETSDWKNIRAFVVSDGFINTIVNFKTESVSNSVREKMKSRYLSNHDYTFEKVNKGSQACGPLYKWAVAQLEYSEMLNKVGPLRNELSQLETEAANNRTRASELDSLIASLETNIARYKEEYAELIRQAQIINSDLQAVEAKVTRSVSLLNSLNQEQSRWEETSKSFHQQMSTIIGDVFLSAAFLAYAGYFDQLARQNFWSMWTGHLLQKGICFREDLAKTEYMSTADERLKWQANSLPSDELCTENAIMLNRFIRYPLIIDPSGQAIEFLLKEHSNKSITKTSFLDDSFRKQLESALRFGNPLIVQDVESFDPILNPVLNKELRRTSGRVLISIGDQDIDFSPSFAIYLSTRDPTMKFSPSLCSKVTFVNFTVTRMSLQSQCLNTVLKVERPDVDTKRSDLIKLQGEFQQRLRKLENGLLQALNDVQGRILDDDSIISNLETLKKEAAEVSAKAKETDNVMLEVERTSQQYLPLSQACSSIFFAMQSMNQIHFLYQYSLQFFLEIFKSVLNNNPHLSGIQDPEQRLKIITTDLFKTSYKRVSRGLLHNDCIVFSMLLAELYLKADLQQENFENEFKFIMQDQQALIPGSLEHTQIDGLSTKQTEGLIRLERSLSQFSGIVDRVTSNISAVKEWVESSNPETIPLKLAVDTNSQNTKSKLREIIQNLLLIQILRPDRFVAAANNFFETVFNSEITVDSVVNLPDIIDNEIESNTPILLCSVTGYDASGTVEELSVQTNRQISSIAIGSAEGFELADAAINRAARNGTWVLLKNVHLAPSWLTQLEKKIHSLRPHESFRLFLSMEINDKVPPSLLRLGRILVYEPAPGIKANLQRIFESLSIQRLERAPKERAHLYFILAWLHSVLVERLRYKPLGWSKIYDFNESDLKCAMDTIDYWVDSVALGRTNLPPEKVPWDALKCLMSKCIYGGRVDNEFDYELVSIFVGRYFTPNSFSPEFQLVSRDESSASSVPVPDAVEKEQFLKWIDDIKIAQSPTWIGLASDSDKVLLANLCTEITSKLLILSNVGVEEAAYEPDTDEANICLDKKPSWMVRLSESAASWIQIIPNALYPLERTSNNIKDPIFRFFDREVKTGSQLLMKVRNDVQQIIDLCEGRIKQTNYLRGLITDLTKGIVPKSWSLYAVPNDITILQWMVDFAQRIEQLKTVTSVVTQAGYKELHKIKLWLGGLFTPQGYLTATRQHVSQAKMWSLEKLQMKVSVVDNDVPLDDCSFAVTGLQLEGAICADNQLEVNLASKHELPIVVFEWIQQEENAQHGLIKIPVYLNRGRSEVLFTLNFPTKHARLNDFYERGVAALLSKL